MGAIRGRVAGVNLEPALNRFCRERPIDPAREQRDHPRQDTTPIKSINTLEWGWG